MFKYIGGYDESLLDERIVAELRKKATLDDFLNSGIRNSMPGWRQQLADKSISGLVDAFGFDEAHTRLAALEPDEIDIDELASHLAQVISRGQGMDILKGNSELKRAIRIYDLLRYRA